MLVRNFIWVLFLMLHNASFDLTWCLHSFIIVRAVEQHVKTQEQ